MVGFTFWRTKLIEANLSNRVNDSWYSSDFEVERFEVVASEGESGIVAVCVTTPSGVVRLE